MNKKYNSTTTVAKGLLLGLASFCVLFFSGSVSARNYSYSVPYLKQLDYSGIGESACAPTSVTMLLRYYYPNSQINVPEVYHAGTQAYGYNSDPAILYRNVSFVTDLKGLPLPSETRPSLEAAAYYTGGANSGAVITNVTNYLGTIWGIGTTQLNIDGVYNAIQNGPLLGHVAGNGIRNKTTGAPSYPHYIVITGLDDKGTVSRADDVIYVNDPYTKWTGVSNGNNRAVPYSTFFNTWFLGAYSLAPPEASSLQRNYTVVVDSGHVDLGNGNGMGNPAIHKLSLDTPTAWKFYYGSGGDWLFPTKAGLAARWTPRLATSGRYEVSVKYRADATSGNVAYVIYRGTTKLAVAGVAQYRSSPGWVYNILAADIRLQNGDSVRAENIPANTNIDAVKFKYLGS